MILRSKLKQWFLEAVALSACPEELKRTLRKDNGRISALINNMQGEFKRADQLLASRGLFLKESTMQTAMYDMTNVLIQGLELEVKRMYETDLAKAARQAEVSKAAEVEDFLSGGTEN